MFCKYCGKKVPDDSCACGNCGAKLNYGKKEVCSGYEFPALKEEEYAPGWALGEKKKESKPDFRFFPGAFVFWSAALLLAFAGNYMMYFAKQITPGVIMYILAALFSAGAYFKSTGAERKNFPGSRIEMVLFILIILTGIFFRMYLIHSVPAGLYADEAQNGAVALSIISGEEVEGQKLPVYVGKRSPENAAMYNYLIAVFFKILGTNTDNIRIATAFIGILSVPAFYFLLRYLFGAGAAVLGGLLFAGMSWHVTFSRIGFHAALAVFLFILVMYFMFRVYKERKWGDFLIFGAVLALSQNTYVAARSIPLLVLLFAFYVFVREPRFYAANFRKILACAGVAFIVFLPMLGYIIKHPDRYMGRAGTVSILNKETVKKFYHGKYTVKERLAENIKEHFLMFSFKGDRNPRHNLPERPMLDYITGALAVLGAAYMLLRFFSPAGFVFVTGFFIFITLGILTIESPQSLRTILLAPVLVVFAAAALKKIIDYSEEWLGSKGRAAAFAASFLLVTAASGVNYDRYFNQYAKDPVVWGNFSTTEYIGGKMLAEKPEGWSAVINRNIFYAPGYTFRYFMNRYIKIPVEHFNTDAHVPYSKTAEKGVAYYLSYEEKVYIDTFMKDLYPNGRYSEIRPPYGAGDPVFIVYEVPAADINAAAGKRLVNGITGRYYDGLDFVPHRLRLKRTDPNIDFSWHIRPLRGGEFSAEWEGSITAERAGRHYFRTISNNYNAVWVNGEKILENKRKNGIFASEGSAVLAEGDNSIRVRYSEDTNGSRMHLYWKLSEDAGYRPVSYKEFRLSE